ncbi:hypothetical protein IW262DRAFT_1294670 [Armillaria fumosa]|nr:hypothetical protein IW262DRAFT_1294670 [Armillaria fumosa]
MGTALVEGAVPHGTQKNKDRHRLFLDFRICQKRTKIVLFQSGKGINLKTRESHLANSHHVLVESALVARQNNSKIIAGSSRYPQHIKKRSKRARDGPSAVFSLRNFRVQNDLATKQPRPTQPIAVETQKTLCDEYFWAIFNKEALAFLQRSLFVIFHDLLDQTTVFDIDNYEEDLEMTSRYYGLDWKDVCDYLGLDSDKGEEQFSQQSSIRLNFPESLQEEMHDMIRWLRSEDNFVYKH